MVDGNVAGFLQKITKRAAFQVLFLLQGIFVGVLCLANMAAARSPGAVAWGLSALSVLPSTIFIVSFFSKFISSASCA